MRRPPSSWPGPAGQDGDNLLERLRSALARLLDRGGPPEQALPMSRARGQTGPVVPYQERRQQLLRARRGQHTGTALAFILVLLVLVLGLFYGLGWALGSFGSQRGGSTPTVVSLSATPTVAPAFSPLPALPTAAPGGVPSPSPSPSPQTRQGPPPGPGTPAAGAQRNYTVKAGDNPASIARQFNVSVEELMRANRITDPRSLRPGDELVIPPESTPVPR